MWSESTERKLSNGLVVGQGVALLCGISAFCAALVYRPYVACGRLMCSFAPEYHRIAPPIPDNGDTIEFDAALYGFQIALVLCVTTIMILIMRKEATRKTILTLFAISIGVLLLLQVATALYDGIISLSGGGPWALLSALLLSLMTAIRMAMLHPGPVRVGITRKDIRNFIDELLLRR